MWAKKQKKASPKAKHGRVHAIIDEQSLPESPQHTLSLLQQFCLRWLSPNAKLDVSSDVQLAIADGLWIQKRLNGSADGRKFCWSPWGRGWRDCKPRADSNEGSYTILPFLERAAYRASPANRDVYSVTISGFVADADARRLRAQN